MLAWLFSGPVSQVLPDSLPVMPLHVTLVPAAGIKSSGVKVSQNLEETIKAVKNLCWGLSLLCAKVYCFNTRKFEIEILCTQVCREAGAAVDSRSGRCIIEYW